MKVFKKIFELEEIEGIEEIEENGLKESQSKEENKNSLEEKNIIPEMYGVYDFNMEYGPNYTKQCIVTGKDIRKFILALIQNVELSIDRVLYHIIDDSEKNLILDNTIIQNINNQENSIDKVIELSSTVERYEDMLVSNCFFKTMKNGTVRRSRYEEIHIKNRKNRMYFDFENGQLLLRKNLEEKNQNSKLIGVILKKKDSELNVENILILEQELKEDVFNYVRGLLIDNYIISSFVVLEKGKLKVYQVIKYFINQNQIKFGGYELSKSTEVISFELDKHSIIKVIAERYLTEK